MLSRKLAAPFLALGLTACGFTPIAAPISQDLNVGIGVTDLELLGVTSRFSYEANREFFKFTARDPAAPYRIRAIVDLGQQAFAIEEDDTVTRINLTYTAEYELYVDGELVDTGELTAATGYNATTSQFATEVSRRDAEEKLAKNLGQKLLSILRVTHTRRS